MSALFEITIKPQHSPRYVRLVLSLHVISALLIFQSSWPMWAQWILIALLAGYYICHFNKSPCMDIAELRLSQHQCLLMMKSGIILRYDNLSVLIHNEWFQLLQLSGRSGKRHLVLFNDQLPLSQLRLLHVKAKMY